MGGEDVSSAWVAWSGTAESALDEAFCFAGDLVLDEGLVAVLLGSALFGWEGLRFERMYQDSTVAP